MKFLIDSINLKPINAIDLGCGQGNDTVYLINNDFKVLGIDKENVESIIRTRLPEEKQGNFTFEKQELENLKIPNTDLIIANFSLSFCKKEYFKSMWENIVESININGYFVGTIFGINDSWNKECRDMSFLQEKRRKNYLSNLKSYDLKK